jgi:putative peptidoglycan lipid II flippase
LAAYKETLAGGLRLVIALILPAAAGPFALAPLVIGLLLQHGRFTAQDTAVTAQVLRLYVIGLPFAAVDQMLVFASYARKDTWRPALAGVASIAIYTAVAVLLLPPLGLLSLMVADAVKHITHTAMMLWIGRRQVGGLAGYRLGETIAKSVAAAGLSAAAAWAVTLPASQLASGGSLAPRALVLALAALAGGLAFLAAVRLLKIGDAQSLWLALRRRPR